MRAPVTETLGATVITFTLDVLWPEGGTPEVMLYRGSADGALEKLGILDPVPFDLEDCQYYSSGGDAE